MELILSGGKTGWEMFCAKMEQYIDEGRTTLDAYMRHLNGNDGFPFVRRMDSFNYYHRWLKEHPNEKPPAEVKRMRSDRQHAEWLEQGCPSIDNERSYCHHCGTHHDPPSVVVGRPVEQR